MSSPQQDSCSLPFAPPGRVDMSHRSGPVAHLSALIRVGTSRPGWHRQWDNGRSQSSRIAELWVQGRVLAEGTVVFKDGFVPSVLLRLSWLTLTKPTSRAGCTFTVKTAFQEGIKGRKMESDTKSSHTNTQPKPGRKEFPIHGYFCGSAQTGCGVQGPPDGAFPCSPCIPKALGSCLLGGRLMILPRRSLIILLIILLPPPSPPHTSKLLQDSSKFHPDISPYPSSWNCLHLTAP